MSSFKVTLVSPDGAENVIQCPDDQYIVDVFAEEMGIDIPYSCRSSCSRSCTGRLVSVASVDQEDQSFLDDEEI